MVDDESSRISATLWAELERARTPWPGGASHHNPRPVVERSRPAWQRFTQKHLICLIVGSLVLALSAPLNNLTPVGTSSIFVLAVESLSNMSDRLVEARLDWSKAHPSSSQPAAVICINIEPNSLQCNNVRGKDHRVEVGARTSLSPRVAVSEENIRTRAQESPDAARQWWLSRGAMLSAEVCNSLLPPRLGCPDTPLSPAHPVEAVPITEPQSANVASLLGGTWRNPGYVLRVDAARAQANVDPASPFRWQRFKIRKMSGNQITFTVGVQVYVAQVTKTSLVLSSTGFRGEETLSRLQ
jgi:hypothetical protein